MNRHDIYSKCERGRLLHSVIFGAPPGERSDLCLPEDALQIAVINAEPGTAFKPHYHIPKECPPSHVTQEAWHIGAGSVVVTYYDLDGQMLEHVGLVAGDTTITFAGGHAYTVGPHGCRALEVKSGPYHGQARDKVWL